MPKDPVYYEQRKINRNSKVKQLAFPARLKENQPLLRIAMITPRPDRTCGINPKNTIETETSRNSRERFEKEEPFKLEDKLLQKVPCITILQLLRELSSPVYLTE